MKFNLLIKSKEYVVYNQDQKFYGDCIRII